MVNAKVYLLDNGRLELDEAWLVAGLNTGTVENKNPPAKWIEVPTYTVLVDHPEGIVHFDLTCNPRAMIDQWPDWYKRTFPYRFTEDQKIESYYKKLGLKPSNITMIVLSHLHADHCGNLDLFKNTTVPVLVHEEELKHAYYATAIGLRGGYVRKDFDIPGLQLESVNPPELGIEVLKDVWVYHMPGHTPGLLILVVHLDKEGTLIFPSDACFDKRNFGPPPILAGSLWNGPLWLNSIERMRIMTRAHKAKMMFSHDMASFQTYK